MVLTAQVDRQATDVVPLKNWATPLYWQPSQTASGSSGRALPQLQFSANQVSSNALSFISITPCRLVDTRGMGANFNGITPFSGPFLAAATTAMFPVQSTTEASMDTTPAPCGTIPSTAQAYSLNITLVPRAGGAVDYISLWPAGGTQPFVSTLDDPQGAIVSNSAIVPAGTPSGGISFYNSGPAATDVVIDMNGFYAAPSDGSFNTAIGTGALTNNTTGQGNTASGVSALNNNSTGNSNTATGFGALGNNSTGSNNTAEGTGALQQNTTGGGNTASGEAALANNTTGNGNTASGFQALESNSIGFDNTASGYGALQANTSGNSNTAAGFAALGNNSTGVSNTAVGGAALQDNTTGNSNVAIGGGALQSNTTACCNIAIGLYALENNTTGSGNIAIGNDAGQSVAGGNNNNIEIGNAGTSGDSGVIRIGTSQTSFFAAGVSGVSTGLTGAVPVVIDGNGQLGTINSSIRFKEDVHDMADVSDGLLRLRPVTYRYKQPYADGSQPIDYGLIAEEVAQVYPDLVVKDAAGQIQTVQYQKLTPMLLNEVQKQNARLQQQVQLQAEENRKLEERLAALEALLSAQTSTAPLPASDR